jgi:succinoglycan biosynthesis transport protein ExoP
VSSNLAGKPTPMQPSEYIEEIDLGKYWLVLKRRWLPAAGIFFATSILGFIYATSNQPIYEATGKILIRTDRTSKLTGLGEELGRLEPVESQANPIDTQVEIIKSTSILEEAISSADLRDDEGDLVTPETLVSQLTVKPIPGTDVVSLKYTSNDPEQAAEVINSISEAYIRNNISTNRAEAVAARSFISRQLPSAENTLNLAENRLREFQENNQTLMEQAGNLLPALPTLKQKIDSNFVEISKIKAQIDSLESKLGTSDPNLALLRVVLSESPAISQALEEYFSVEAELADQESLFTSSTPSVNVLNQKRENLKQLLEERIAQISGNQNFELSPNLTLSSLETEMLSTLVQLDTQKEQIQIENDQLEALIIDYQSQVERLPELRQEERRLQQNVDIAKQNYEALEYKAQEIQFTENQVIGNAIILSSASVPGSSVGPNTKLIIAGTLLAGSFLGILTALGLDLLDRSVKTEKEVKEIFNYPILGRIPYFERPKGNNYISFKKHYSNESFGKPYLTIEQNETFEIQEAYQALRTNLKLLQEKLQFKSLLITSATPSEGKSEIAVNLAVTFAKTGHKVLLVDANLRHPELHTIFSISNEIGLSHVISNQAEVHTTIRHVANCLDVLTVGEIPTRPAILLDSKELGLSLSRLAFDYELIILDGPSLEAYAETLTLGSLADEALLVTGLGLIDYSVARTTKDTFVQANQDILGIVVNCSPYKDK